MSKSLLLGWLEEERLRWDLRSKECGRKSV